MATRRAGWLGLAVFAVAGCGGEPPQPRVVLVALDGATWDVIDPLIAAGQLPSFARLRREGASGPLRTLTEPREYESAALWTTVATGRHPADHGIPGNTLDGAPPTSNVRRTPALWNLLGARGRTVGVVGWYVTWPAERVNGFVVSDRAMAEAPRAVSPAGLLGPDPAAGFWAWAPASRENARRLRRFVDFDLDPEGARVSDDPRVRFHYQLVARRLAWVYPRDESYARLGLRLLEARDPAFFAIYFRGIDYVSHAFWMFREPDAPGYHPRARALLSPDGIARLGGAIDRYYAYQDELLGRLLERAGADATVLVVSDHGFGPRAIEDEHWQLTGSHRVDGILAVLGPGVRAGARVDGASLFDVAPSVLALFGLPAAADMPGRVLTELFEPGAAPPEHQRIPSYGGEADRAPAAPIPSPADAEIRERLRALGYLPE